MAYDKIITLRGRMDHCLDYVLNEEKTGLSNALAYVENPTKTLSELMDMEGAQCELAVNGQEAVEMFLRSEPEYYDLILMDVQMPVMNGYEATRKIRACDHPRAGSVPIVAMTANAFAEDVQNALDAGMNGHLPKPIDMDAVKALLGRLRKGQDIQTADASPQSESKRS